MAALYVSGDTDYGQGVDAGQAKEQSEEAIHLEGQRTQLVSRAHIHRQISTIVCLIADVLFSRSQSPAFFSLICPRRRIFPPILSRRIRKLKRKLSIRLHNSLIEFRVWGDYLLIMALVKGNYTTGLGSGSNCDTMHPAVPFPGDMDQLRSS